MISVHHLDWRRTQDLGLSVFTCVVIEARPSVVFDLWERGYYAPAALVETDDVERAYVLTNTLRNHWTKNPGVEALGPEPRRSTCIGDLIFTTLGSVICRPAGFAPIYLDPMPLEIPATNNEGDDR